MARSTPSLPNSRLGIASFVLSLMPIVAMIIIMITVYGHMGDFSTEEAMDKANLSKLLLPMMLSGFLILGSLLLSLIFGLITVFQKEKKRAFGIAGLCITVGWILFFVISSLAQNSAQ